MIAGESHHPLFHDKKMIDRRFPLLRFCLLALILFAVTACGGPRSEDDSDAQSGLPSGGEALIPAAPSYLSMAPEAPPTAPVEAKPVIADPKTETWRAGYWSYDNGQFSWVPGTVISKPTLSAVWSPDHWEKREYGWVFVCGHWV